LSVEGFQASEMLVLVVAVTRRLVGVVGGVLSPRLGVVVVVGFGRGAAPATDPTEPPMTRPDRMTTPTAIRRPPERCATILPLGSRRPPPVLPHEIRTSARGGLRIAGIIEVMPLPRRLGPRPATTPTNPHTQLDQQPDGSEQREQLATSLFALAGVVERPSLISVPGARALWLDEGAAGPPEAFMVEHEFAHLHPGPDQSLHAMLPPALAVEAVEAGWAEQHPVARRGLIAANAVMLYAPRDDAEREVVEELVRAAHAFARGEVA
jgi:hypothetical protein